MVDRVKHQGVYRYMRLVQSRVCALIVPLLLLAACGSPHSSRLMTSSSLAGSVTGDSSDRRVLAGEWDYEEMAVVLLTLDEAGNGTYGWKKGQFRTVALNGLHWEGIWLQEENDREGLFVVELSPDLSEGDGRWWYTRIGDDRAPTAKGGTFHLTRRISSVAASDTPPAP
ncbi:conserved hypothetical protein [Nitrospira lenta]|uniref:Lipoprotein n=2 Tax=Nitrospira lenta TaxID=1436998 RepID=A0A330LC53_9BACT|nr:conserved hypothetical protein [Nitrospira lenta]